MLDDPRVNFAISVRGSTPGVEHLGIQVDSTDELAEVYGRLRQADAPVLEEGHTTCCYAKSEKSWVTDPAGLSWEVFHTYGGNATYGGGATAINPRLASTAASTRVEKAKAACCGPAA